MKNLSHLELYAVLTAIMLVLSGLLVVVRRWRLQKQIAAAVLDHLSFAATHPAEFAPHHEILAIRQRVERMRGRSMAGIDHKVRLELNRMRTKG